MTKDENESWDEVWVKRPDIVHKSLLRSVKRFYLQEFRKDNKKATKNRYRQVQSKNLVECFKTTCQRLLGDIPNIESVSQFLMVISWFKPGDRYLDDAIKFKGELVLQVMNRYSRENFKKIFEIEELGILIKYLANNHQEELLQSTSQNKIRNTKVYAKALDDWMKKFTL